VLAENAVRAARATVQDAAEAISSADVQPDEAERDGVFLEYTPDGALTPPSDLRRWQGLCIRELRRSSGSLVTTP
jgi:hypothetical protein